MIIIEIAYALPSVVSLPLGKTQQLGVPLAPKQITWVTSPGGLQVS